MNEQIKELWKQSQTRQEVETFTEGIFTTRVTDNYEKFAELIVEECVNIGNKAFLTDNSTVSVFPSAAIKNHFGVK